MDIIIIRIRCLQSCAWTSKRLKFADICLALQESSAARRLLGLISLNLADVCLD